MATLVPTLKCEICRSGDATVELRQLSIGPVPLCRHDWEYITTTARKRGLGQEVLTRARAHAIRVWGRARGWNVKDCGALSPALLRAWEDDH